MRLALAGRIFWFYLSKAFLPFRLNLVYPQWQVQASSFWADFPDLAFLALMAVFWRFRRGWGRHVLFGLGVYAIALFPVLGFFESQFLTKWQVSDHLQYLPLIAPVTLAAAVVASIVSSVTFRAVSAALLLVLSSLTFQRTRVFRSEEMLFRDSLAKNPAAGGLENDLGVLMARRGNFPEALQYLQGALHNNPDNADAESNLAQVLAAQGKFQDAEPHFLAALKLDPANSETHRRFAGIFSPCIA